MSKHVFHAAAQGIMTGEPVCAEPSTTFCHEAMLFEENAVSGYRSWTVRAGGIGGGTSVASQGQEFRMNSPQTIVKQRVREKSGWRGSVGPSTGTAGQMVAEQMRVEVPPDRLRVRAYEIYLARRDAPEDAESDWVRAERELKGRADGAPGPESRSTDPVSVEFEASTDDSRQRVSLARSRQ